MPFKPMLASNVKDFKALRFPAMVSPKLDGIRAMMQDGRLLSRSLKPIANVNVQEMFAGLPNGTDGELIVGNPADNPYLRTTPVVMSRKEPADGVKLYVFDRFDERAPFIDRYAAIDCWEKPENVVLVPHIPVLDMQQLEEAEQLFLARGYEGLMYRDPNGPYKQGRSSEREGYLLKVKRFEDAEARIESCYEEMENQNVAFTNELGRTARSSHKAGKVGKNQLGGFHVVGVGGTFDGVRFDVPSGAMSHEMRKTLWQCQPELIGRLVCYKFFPQGGKDAPRHPIFKGFRDPRDLS